MPLSFIDSSVLIDAIRGEPEIAAKAAAVLDEPTRQYASSKFVRLEVLPHAVHFKHVDEVAFYNEVFSKVVAWADADDTLVEAAIAEATAAGLGAADALHVAAAARLKCDELLTSEGPTKSIHRAKSVRIVSIR